MKINIKALDDILVARDLCQIQPKKASPQLQSISLVNCNFEKTFCNWKIVTVNTQFKWELYSNTKFLISMIQSGPKYGANNSTDYLIADQDQNKKGNNSLKIFYFIVFLFKLLR
jgi:hypothetical protein